MLTLSLLARGSTEEGDRGELRRHVQLRRVAAAVLVTKGRQRGVDRDLRWTLNMKARNRTNPLPADLAGQETFWREPWRRRKVLLHIERPCVQCACRTGWDELCGQNQHVLGGRAQPGRYTEYRPSSKAFPHSIHWQREISNNDVNIVDAALMAKAPVYPKPSTSVVLFPSRRPVASTPYRYPTPI